MLTATLRLCALRTHLLASGRALLALLTPAPSLHVSRTVVTSPRTLTNILQRAPFLLYIFPLPSASFFFFLNDPAPPEIYPLPPPDALPILYERRENPAHSRNVPPAMKPARRPIRSTISPNAGVAKIAARNTYAFIEPASCSDSPCACWKDRKSTRLNSSHLVISYAVFCLKQ